MGQQYRVGIIGCGRIAKLHAGFYNSDPRCAVVALADIKREGAEKFAADNGFTKAAIYTDYAQMLAAEKPDIVSVCLWTHLHLPVVRDCCRAGVRAIHCEKPVAAVWGECLDMLAAGRESGVQLTFNHQRRFLPIFRRAKAILDNGELGRLERMECGVHMHLLDMGTHYIDLLNMFNADTPAVWVFGQTDSREVKRWFNVPCEFAAITHVKYANGARAVIHCGNDNGFPDNTGFRLFCERGTIEMPGWYRTLRVRGHDGKVREESFDKEQEGDEGAALYRGVIGDITGGLEGAGTPQLSAENAIRAAEIIFATYESSRRRCRVDLPLDARDASFEAIGAAAS